MLDDLKMIHQRDGQDALGIAEKQWQQLKHTYEIENWDSKAGDCENVILAGMGGSALAGGIFQSTPGLNVPFEVVKDYDLPVFANENTLFIASSYSGNTEETLSALDQARSKGCKIVIISAGGKLADIAKENDYPLFNLPTGKQPRMAVFYNYAALWQLFCQAGLCDEKVETLHKAADWLKDESGQFLPDAKTDNNTAKKIALELAGSSVVIYSGHKLFPAAYKWKININENAKTVAWCNQLPEFNHNEMLGWSSHPIDKPYKIIDLRAPVEHERTQKRFEVTERMLSGKRPQPEVIVPNGGTLLEQMLWSVQLGDFVSLYLALLNGLDPTPVELIEKFKSELS